MRYKIIICSMLLGLTISFTGCQKDTDEQEVVSFDDIKPSEPEPVIIRDDTAQEEEPVEEETTSEEESESVQAYCDLEQVSYDIEEATYEEGTVKISYPQLINMENTELMETMNENIKKMVVHEDLAESDPSMIYQVTYEVATQGTGILSVVFRGHWESDDGAHPNDFMQTLNLRLSTGENVRMKDYADIETIVTDLETDQGYTILSTGVDQTDFSAFLNNGSVTDYAITMLDYDIDFTQDFVPSGYSYIKDNHPVLCIEAEHSMGDYVEVCIDNIDIVQ